MQPLQLGPRFHADLIDERRSGLAVGRERIGLPAPAVERQHELPAQPLAKRVLHDKGLELADQLVVPAGGQLAVDGVLDRLQPQLLEPADLDGGERLVRHVLERPPPPQRERLAQRPARDQALEPPRVDVIGRHPELVSARSRDDRGAIAGYLQRFPHTRDVRPQRLGSRRRRLLAPQPLDQTLGGNRPRRAQRQNRQQGSLLGATNGHRPPIDAGLYGSQEPDVHGRVPPATLSAPQRDGNHRLQPTAAELMPNRYLRPARSPRARPSAKPTRSRER